MDCFLCKTANPEGQKYCGNCGAPLSSDLDPLGESYEPIIQQHVTTALREQLVDRELVELRACQDILTRVQQWARLLGFFVGIPVALLMFILAFWGIRTFSDFSNKVDEVELQIEEQIIQEIQEANQDIQQANQDIIVARESISRTLQRAASLEQQIALHQENISATAKIAELQIEQVAVDVQRNVSTTIQRADENVAKLEQRVDEVEKQVVRFEESIALTPEIKKSVVDTISSYQDYWERIGFSVEGEVNVLVEVSPGRAYYDPAENLMVISSSVISDTDVILREYTHFILASAVDEDVDLLSKRLGTALESGLADYFPSSFSSDPRIGEIFGKQVTGRPYIRNLDNDRKFTEVSLSSNRGGEEWEMGEIWGGAFWEMRQRIGQATTDDLIFAAWQALDPSDNTDQLPANFVRRLLEVGESLEGANTDQIREIFEGRELGSFDPAS